MSWVTRLIVTQLNFISKAFSVDLSRVSFGPNHLFVFHHPQDLAKKVNAGEKVETPTFDTAQEEIAKSSGLMGAAEGKSKGKIDFYSWKLVSLLTGLK